MLEDFYSLSEMKTINAGLHLILGKVGLGNNKELELLISKTESYIDELMEKEDKND